MGHAYKEPRDWQGELEAYMPSLQTAAGAAVLICSLGLNTLAHAAATSKDTSTTTLPTFPAVLCCHSLCFES